MSLPALDSLFPESDLAVAFADVRTAPVSSILGLFDAYWEPTPPDVMIGEGSYEIDGESAPKRAREGDVPSQRLLKPIDLLPEAD